MKLTTNKTKKIFGLIFLIFLVVWLAVLVYMSCMTGEESKVISGSISGAIDNSTSLKDQLTQHVPVDEFHSFVSHIRKLFGHFGAYFLGGTLGLLSFSLLFENDYVGLILNLVICVFASLLTELIQLFIPGRICSYIDIILNLEGYLTATILLSSVVFTINVCLKKRILSSITGKYAIYGFCAVLTEFLYLIFKTDKVLYYLSNLFFISTMLACLIITFTVILINASYQKRKAKSSLLA